MNVLVHSYTIMRFLHDLLLDPFRGADSNLNTDIKNAGDYHVNIIVISGAISIDVHAFQFCFYCFACIT